MNRKKKSFEDMLQEYSEEAEEKQKILKMWRVRKLNERKRWKKK